VRAMYCVVKYSPLLRRRRRVAGRLADPAAFEEADANLESTLESLDEAHNYVAWIYSMTEPYLGRDVLEVGSGHGSLTFLLAEHAEGAGGRLVASDPSERCADVLRARYRDDPAVEVVQADAAAAADKGPFDSIVMVNVLEHIEDDLGAVRQLADGLRPGGRLIAWVPAHQSLYSEYDRSIGHHRRYRKGSLAALAKSARLEVEDIRYANAPGAVAWWLVARGLNLRPTTPGRVRTYDSAVVPLLRRIESRVRVPFGQSVFLVARRLPGAG
jgi:SAM-dependent methyltransferase